MRPLMLYPLKKGVLQKFPTNKMWDDEINVSLKGSFFMIKFFEKRWSEEKVVQLLILDQTYLS